MAESKKKKSEEVAEEKEAPGLKSQPVRSMVELELDNIKTIARNLVEDIEVNSPYRSPFLEKLKARL